MVQKGFLSDEHGRIHIFDVSSVSAVRKSHEKDAGPVVVDIPKIGILELPLHISNPVFMTPVGDSPYVARVLAVTESACVCIFEVEGPKGSQTSNFKILSDISHTLLFGGEKGSRYRVPYVSAGRTPSEGDLTNQRCVFDRSATLLTCLGIDGAVRLFEPNSLLGIMREADETPGLNAFTEAEGTVQSIGRHKGMGRSNSTNVRSTKASRLREEKILKDITDRNELVQENVQKIKTPQEHVEVVKPKVKRTPPMTPKEKELKVRQAMKQEKLLRLPLFELAKLSPEETRITTMKLRAYLRMNDQFPPRFRTLIWRFLLKLPENTDAYVDLVNRGPHNGFVDLENKFPLRSRRVFERLHRCCCQLAHWSPVFAQVSYVVQCVFPFLLIYGSDEMAAFETVVTLLCLWGNSWQATYPQPPVHILDTADGLLHHHDSKIYSHITHVGVSVGVICWNMYSTFFTEVLSKSDWLVLMDFLFSHITTVTYFYLAPIAIIRCSKSLVLTIVDDLALVKFYRYQQQVNMKEVIAVMKQMLLDTPNKLLSIVARPKISLSEDSDDEHDLTGSAFRVGYDDRAQARESIAQTSGNFLFPLPSGRYPAFSGFPEYLVDWQLKDRERAINMEHTVSHHESTVRELEETMRKLQQDHERWVEEKGDFTGTAEINLRKKIMENERVALQDLIKIEEDTCAARIKSIEAEEQASVQHFALLEKLSAESQDIIAKTEEFMQEKLAATINMQRTREMVEAAEVSAHERVSRLYMNKMKEEWMTALALSIESKEKELESNAALLTEKWRNDDEVERRQRALRSQAAEADLQREAYEAMQDDALQRLQKLQLTREAKIMEIERARAVRLAREQADEAEKIAARSQRAIRRSNEAKVLEERVKVMNSGLSAVQQHVMDTVQMISDEGDRLIAVERKYIEGQRDAEMGKKNKKLRAEWAAQKERQLREILASERSIQEQVLRMQRAVVEAGETLR